MRLVWFGLDELRMYRVRDFFTLTIATESTKMMKLAYMHCSMLQSSYYGNLKRRCAHGRL